MQRSNQWIGISTDTGIHQVWANRSSFVGVIRKLSTISIIHSLNQFLVSTAMSGLMFPPINIIPVSSSKWSLHILDLGERELR